MGFGGGFGGGFSQDSRPAVGGGDGATVTELTIVPIIADSSLVYTESGGLLVGSGGALDGREVQNFALFDSITEYPDRFEFILGDPGAHHYWGYTTAAPNDAAALILGTCVGNSEVAVNFESDAATLSRNIFAGKWSGNANTDNDTRQVGALYKDSIMYPRAMAFGAARLGTSHNPVPTWTDDQWIGFESIDGMCDWKWKELEGDAWVTPDPDEWDCVGAQSKLGVGFGAQNGATSVLFIVYKITAAFYASSELDALP